VQIDLGATVMHVHRFGLTQPCYGTTTLVAALWV
jgi:hypothetical protein